MKKIVILGGAALALYMLFGNSKAVAATPQTNTTPADFFTQYNNNIVIDGMGIWFLVRDGKLHGFTNEASLNAYQAANPAYSTPINMSENIWVLYADRIGESV